MAHFAKLNPYNQVVRVVVVHNNECLDENGQESEAKGIAFCQNLFGGNWVQTSYNGNFRKNFAGISYTYDSARDAFIAPKPYASWSLNEDTCKWEAPIAFPNDGKNYRWDEDLVNWIEVTE